MAVKLKRRTYIKICRHHRVQWFESDLRKGQIRTEYGRVFEYKGEEILKRVRLTSYYKLDWHDTYIDDPEELDGFLAPDGTWTGCPYGLHSECADKVLGGKTVSDLEELGYVHISNDSLDLAEPHKLTVEQHKWLIGHGYEAWAKTMTILREEIAPVRRAGRDLVLDALLGSSVEVGLRRLSQRTGD